MPQKTHKNRLTHLSTASNHRLGNYESHQQYTDSVRRRLHDTDSFLNMIVFSFVNVWVIWIASPDENVFPN